nr:NAD(P)-dependent oxidoreductase [Halomicroarcula sp. XH51]
MLVIDSLETGRNEFVPQAAEFSELDLRSDTLETALEGFDPHEIFHLAAIHYVPYCNENPGEAFDVNIMGTRNLFESVKEISTVETVVNTSSAAVYPSRERALSEDVTPDPMDVYGKTKLVGEDLANRLGTESEVTTVSARLFNVYGPQETNPHLIPAILEQIRDGSETIELGNLSPRRDFVHVDDVTRALMALADLDESAPRAFNVGSGKAWSVQEVAEAVGSALESDIEIEQEASRVRESDRPHLEADIDRIERETDWSPQIGLRKGLSDLLEHQQPKQEPGRGGGTRTSRSTYLEQRATQSGPGKQRPEGIPRTTQYE